MAFRVIICPMPQVRKKERKKRKEKKEEKERERKKEKERKKEREVAQSCPTLCNPGFFQARILEWVAISFSRRSS